MGIFINGINISNCSGMSGNSQKFDEKKNVRADGINRITIQSDSANIIVTASNTNTIDAHFYGEAVTGEKPTLNISKNGREVVVTLNIGSCFMSNGLTLSVNIPMQMFEMLTAISYNRNVEIKDGVSAKKMRLNSHNGDVESEGNFTEISAITHNGDVDVYINAKSDVEIEADSHNGNVTVELQNITTSNISMYTRNGSVRNRFRGTNGGYTAYGRATSYNGNVAVR